MIQRCYRVTEKANFVRCQIVKCTKCILSTIFKIILICGQETYKPKQKLSCYLLVLKLISTVAFCQPNHHTLLWYGSQSVINFIANWLSINSWMTIRLQTWLLIFWSFSFALVSKCGHRVCHIPHLICQELIPLIPQIFIGPTYTIWDEHVRHTAGLQHTCCRPALRMAQAVQPCIRVTQLLPALLQSWTSLILAWHLQAWNSTNWFLIRATLTEPGLSIKLIFNEDPCWFFMESSSHLGLSGLKQAWHFLIEVRNKMAAMASTSWRS